MTNKKVVSKCTKSKCVKVRKDRTCLAFIDPEFQWVKGQCYGYTNNVWDLRRIFDAIWNYKPKTSKLTKYFTASVAECLDTHDKEE